MTLRDDALAVLNDPLGTYQREMNGVRFGYRSGFGATWGEVLRAFDKAMDEFEATVPQIAAFDMNEVRRELRDAVAENFRCGIL